MAFYVQVKRCEKSRFHPGIDAIASGQIIVASMAEAQCRVSSSAKRLVVHRAS
jgi:hypothetical protein